MNQTPEKSSVESEIYDDDSKVKVGWGERDVEGSNLPNFLRKCASVWYVSCSPKKLRLIQITTSEHTTQNQLTSKFYT
jgi:hypothetical protein